MRCSLLTLALLVAITARADDFGLRRVLLRPVITATGIVDLEISTQGPQPSDWNVPAHWTVQVTCGGANPASVTFSPASPADLLYDTSTSIVTIHAPVASFAGIDPATATISVVFVSGGRVYSATQRPPAKRITAAKARQDADIYLAGSFLAGVATKPIWMIDAKVGYADQLGKNANVRLGVYGELSTNTDTKAPNDRAEIDPDSIRAYTKIFGSHYVGGPSLYSINWEVQPAGGEFTRDNPSSNFVSGGRLRFIMPLGGLPVDFAPVIGGELGHNLNKPPTLFDLPVNLGNYNAIARLLGGADANYYVFRPRDKISGDDPYRFVFSASWLARVPFAAEPFTTAEFVTGSDGTVKRQKIVRMRQNTRHYVQANGTWNLTKLLGVQIQYRYGSLPPLFVLVNHQATIGFVLKGKVASSHSFQ